jgi:hypothetical protein
MTVGPDNNLWFVEENTSKIGQFVIGSGFKEFPTTTASADPFHIVSGPDGNLWFVENAVGKIGYITTAGSLGPEYSIPSGANSGPRSINVGSDNNLWFTEEGSTVNKIGQIVIANLPAMTEFTSPTSVTPWGIRSEPDDALWFTDYTTSAIARITTAGIFTGFYPTPTINSEPRSVIVGPDNAIWFTEQNGNNIGRISPSIVFTAAHDFNGDNMSDILWENSGNVALWLMNGKSTLQTGSLGTVSGWSIIGQQAFKGVTAAAGPQSQTADILWRDTAGDLAIWFMNGLTVSSTAGLGNVPTHWNVYGTADLNGNGNGDILWYDNGTGGSGTVAVWFMNSSGTVQSTASLGTVPPSSGWTILGDSGVGCGGVGCGGGIFWQDSAGDLAVWKLTGGQVTGSSGLGTVSPSSGWVVQGVGNFEGSSNGGTDILWYNTASGAVAIWTISNGQVQSTASVATVPPSSGWKIAQIGDYNGDGMSDILWIDGSGDVAVWFMNGPTIASTAGYGSVGTSWQVQNLNANN